MPRMQTTTSTWLRVSWVTALVLSGNLLMIDGHAIARVRLSRGN